MGKWVNWWSNITIMKPEENKKQEELTDEQLDNVAGGSPKEVDVDLDNCYHPYLRIPD